ncbi:MAG: hypothetical protein ACLVI6_08505 [Bifidobacterium bifidum]
MNKCSTTSIGIYRDRREHAAGHRRKCYKSTNKINAIIAEAAGAAWLTLDEARAELAKVPPLGLGCEATNVRLRSARRRRRRPDRRYGRLMWRPWASSGRRHGLMPLLWLGERRSADRRGSLTSTRRQAGAVRVPPLRPRRAWLIYDRPATTTSDEEEAPPHPDAVRVNELDAG